MSDFEEPDFNPEDEEAVTSVLEREAIRPCEMFQGRALWPFTPCSRSLYEMALSDGDTRIFRIAAFIFIHIRRSEAGIKAGRLSDEKIMEADLSANIVPLVFENPNLLRYRIIEFAAGLSAEDANRALAIARKELHYAWLSEVDATPPDIPGSQKKRGATNRRKPRGKSSRSRKK